MARLQLLDHGLLKESQVIAEMAPKSRATTTTDEATGEEEEDVPTETVEQFSKRIDDAVRQFIEQATADEGIADVDGAEQKTDPTRHRVSGRDDYKDGLVYAERKAVLHEFGRKAYAKCSHCSAAAYTYRKEGHVKIIEYELSKKHLDQNRALGRKRPNVLALAQKRAAKAKLTGKRPADADSDSGHGSSESSDDEADDAMEVDGDSSEGEGEDLIDDLPPAVAKGINGIAKGARGRNERIMMVEEVREHLRLVFKKQPVVASLLYGRHGPNVWQHDQGAGSSLNAPSASADIFFMEVVPVPPTRFRPASKMGDSLFENPQNSLLAKILTTGQTIVANRQRLLELESAAEEAEEALEKTAKDAVLRTWTFLLENIFQIQHDVNSFLDSSKNPTIMKGGMLPPAGVKQILEKKEGLFRKHMMGKRVNFAARSVISPDINIETNEIGVPPVFARKLTFPEPVTPHNVHIMRQLVINGPKTYPGATMVQNEDGQQISLDRKTIEERTAIANQLLTPQEGSTSSGPNSLTTRSTAVNKKVLRHLQDGDILILNRQPTLHKPSMMAHRAKILKGEKTIRMHYANCNSYNADFDGDEMNIHFPQNEVAQAEARMLANTDNQYLGPTSGSPLRGLIQDHVVAGVHMCNKATFFSRQEYHQLIYGALRPEDNYTGQGRIHLLPPAIWKPQPLWTGKQIISTIMLNITPPNMKGLNLSSKNKIMNSLWRRDDGKDPNMSEEQAVFLDGYLVRGILDKSQYGASAYGLVHSVFEVYGPSSAGRLLGILSRLLTKYLQHIAFTCRMDDLILTQEGEKIRAQILEDAQGDGARAAMEYVGLPKDSDPNDPDTARNLAIRLEEILRDDDMMAGLDGAMQAAFNKTTSKINNDVIPAHLIKPFPENNMQTMTLSGAKGSKVNATQISTLLGQQALEGRRVPTMVSGKTLPSFKPFDTSARAGGYVANRFLTGVRPQEYYFHCMAGREGLIDTAVKTSRSGYLQRCLIKHLEGIKVHYDHTVRDADQSVLQFFYGEDALDVVRQKHLYQFDFCVRNMESFANRFSANDIEGKMNEDAAVSLMKKALKKPHKYPPAMSQFSPSRYLGSMSEKFAAELDKYVENNPGKLLGNKKTAAEDIPQGMRQSQLVAPNAFKTLSRVRYVRSLVDPGEGVGLMASQGYV